MVWECPHVVSECPYIVWECLHRVWECPYRVYPEIPPDTCTLLYGSGPATFIDCILSSPLRSTVNNCCRETEEFPG